MKCMWLFVFEGVLGPAECITAIGYGMSRDVVDRQIDRNILKSQAFKTRERATYSRDFAPTLHQIPAQVKLADLQVLLIKIAFNSCDACTI